MEITNGFVLLPIKPTKEIIELLAFDNWPEDYDEGIRVKKIYGHDVVPPVCECEIAAGKYSRLIKLLQK